MKQLVRIPLFLSLLTLGPTAPSVEGADRVRGTVLPPQRPSAFVENRGQWASDARFVADHPGLRAAFDGRGLTLTSQAGGVRLSFRGASDACRIEGEKRLPGVHHFFLGKDPAAWRTGVPGFAAIRYAGLYDGVDLRVREASGDLEYDVLLAPGADPARVEIEVEEALGLRIAEDGALVATTAQGELRQKPPVTWETGPDGEHRPVECRFRILDERRFGFEVPDRNPLLACVIDPGLVWSTFLGGSAGEAATRVAHTGNGEVVVMGSTSSADFPVTPGAGTGGGGGDLFVSRLSADGSQLIYSTTIGGSGGDTLNAAVADAASGLLFLGGSTNSPDFPASTGAFQTLPSGGLDGFVMLLDLATGTPWYSSYLGGTLDDSVLGIGNLGAIIYVTGISRSADFPVTPQAFQTAFGGGFNDGFVTALVPGGGGASDLLFSSYLGGSDMDSPTCLSVDPVLGRVVVAGESKSQDYPTTPGAFSLNRSGPSDCVLSILSLDLSALTYSTYFGGSSISSEGIQDLALHSGWVFVSGYTSSPDLPTTPGVFQPLNPLQTGPGVTGMSGFVACFHPQGLGAQDLVRATYLGGIGIPGPLGFGGGGDAKALSLNSSGGVVVVGMTAGGFPVTTGVPSPSMQGVMDVYVARLSPDFSTLEYATHLGGTGGFFALEMPHDVALDETGRAVTVGSTAAFNFPTTPGTLQGTLSGFSDGFVSLLDLLPTGVQPYGTATAGTRAPLAVGGFPMPQQGQAFTCTLDGCVPGEAALLVLGNVPHAAGLPLPFAGGASLHLDPAGGLATFFAVADPFGRVTVPLFLPMGTQNMTFHAQFLVLRTNGWLASSGALTVTVQP